MAAAPRKYSYYDDELYENALKEKPNDSMRNVTGMLTYTHERVTQNATSTYVLIGLLSLMSVCLGFVFLFSPNRPLLPKSPCSIAARMSLIAGSQLVKELRGERSPGNSSRMRHAQISKPARLGWWTGEDGSRFRWGIDVGDGCIDGSWENEPAGREESTVSVLPHGDTTIRNNL